MPKKRAETSELEEEQVVFRRQIVQFQLREVQIWSDRLAVSSLQPDGLEECSRRNSSPPLFFSIRNGNSSKFFSLHHDHLGIN
ncbi:hypothetical protein Y1Q_0011270 [Alligator mississippiensis]|uniref:Uncharacterized protein n=1 Tax=Alligator mississippiensis TaxID=8496 RepID=A0A151N828_ALLMI|nr:hypothetical protein Y1Q_0011270 [Alligator mississippiensis]